jgi:hypothetical protein
MALQSLGEFQIQTEEVIVGDPCYTLKDEKLIVRLPTIVNGSWAGYVDKITDENNREVVKTLYAFHQSHKDVSLDYVNNLYWFDSRFFVGVDSGQVAIFDAEAYQKDELIDYDPKFPDGTKWYRACCDITLSPQQAGILPGGVITRSGYGDGGYKLFYCTSDYGFGNGLKVEFVD